MRKDMSKVIVERPRTGAGWDRKGRTRALADDEDAPLRARDREQTTHPTRRRTKALNENLAPLRRFLESSVGRPWNKVQSELSEHIRPTSTVQQHVLDHVKDFVATNTAMRDGKVVVYGRFSRKAEPIESSWALLYVHPKTGLLKKNRAYRQPPPAQRKKDRPDERRRELGPFRQAHRFADGAWWDVVIEPNPTRIETVRDAQNHIVRSRVPLPFSDVVIDAGHSDLPPERLYGRAGVHAVSITRLTKAQRKALGLP